MPNPPVPFRTLFLKMGGWVVIISGIFVALMSILGHFAYQAAKQFERDGRAAVATVEEKYTTQRRDANGDTVTTRWLVLSFTTQLGEDVVVRRVASQGEYARAEVGGAFDLLYLESRPDRVELTAGQNRSAARFQQIAALVIGIIWLGSLWLVGGWAVAAVRARRFGERIGAQVLDIKQTGIRIAREQKYRLIWKDDQGRMGRSLLRARADLAHLKPGDRIEIYRGIKHGWWADDIGDRSG
jgi:hypothetical protein